MIDVIWATPLYEFLRQCNASLPEKTILDCGAGGSPPPLSLFYQYGYRTCGVEIAEEALAKAHGGGRLKQAYIEYIARKR